MAGPDFALSRRQLRRARIKDILHLDPEGVNVRRHRDRLLEPLAFSAAEELSSFDSLAEDSVDTVVSLALTELDESAIDVLSVVLLALEVLAGDGQFAKLKLLADKLHTISARLKVDRPFLALATQSFAYCLQGRADHARQSLNEQLGLGRRAPEVVPSRGRESINDLLAAATLRSVLTTSSTAFVDGAREAATRSGDGLLLAFVDAVAVWRTAFQTADPLAVLTEADSAFQSEELQRYVVARAIGPLFPAQIMAIHAGATLDEDRIVSMPTSSGKTLLAEFRIAATLTRNPKSRAIYVAPYRLLARQVERTFGTLSRRLGLVVRDLGTGYDTRPSDGHGLGDVVICTPERLDALLRLSTSDQPGRAAAAELFESCAVLVFDELQLVGRPGRGPRFELVLTRLRAKFPQMKFLGLSAATHGTDDVANWLAGGEKVEGARRPTGTLEILWSTNGALLQRVPRRPPSPIGELPRKNALDDAAKLLLRLDKRYQPALAVCTNRKNAQSLADKVLKGGLPAAEGWRASLSEAESTTLAEAVEEVRALLGANHPLATAMEGGVAFHHAGVPTHVLQQIERLAERRLLRVVCATTTVAEGADLPFRVVVIPHLNFPGRSRRLERDLYLNIIGRAGRANVSVEGVVFVLGTEARTLSTHVTSTLWSTAAPDRIKGRLSEITPDSFDLEDYEGYQEVKSQVMGWLGDGASYVENQASVLANSTFTYQSGDRLDKRDVVALFDKALRDLEYEGFALAGSPYQLTSRGRSARLTGLSTPSVRRLELAIERGRDGWLADLAGITEISSEISQQVARLVFETVEVFSQSLWLKRETGSSEAAVLHTLRAFGSGDLEPDDSTDFDADIALLSGWLLGLSYVDLAADAPTYPHAASLFGGSQEHKRTSDATEYIGKITYPAGWAWSAAQVLIEGDGVELPSFMRDAIEFGVPSEAAAALVRVGHLTRSAALSVASMAGSQWDAARDWLTDEDHVLDAVHRLTRLDADRLRRLHEQLSLEAD